MWRGAPASSLSHSGSDSSDAAGAFRFTGICARARTGRSADRQGVRAIGLRSECQGNASFHAEECTHSHEMMHSSACNPPFDHFCNVPPLQGGGALCGDYVCAVAIVSTACSVHGLSGGLLQEPVLPVPWRNASFHVNLCIPPHEMMHSPLHSLNVRSFDPIAGVSHCWRRLLVKHRRGG